MSFSNSFSIGRVSILTFMPLSHETLLMLKCWNTPTIYNGWEQITKSDPAKDGFNMEPTKEYMQEMGPMVGYAVTAKIQPSKRDLVPDKPHLWSEYREYVASVEGPKIVVVQDCDKPNLIGAFWGEVNSNIHRALGCVGTVIDGAIRDLDEMKNAGFKALARGMCVGHAYSVPVEWGGDVERFGRSVISGQLVHADKHGFLAIPREDEEGLLEASIFMDKNECDTVIRSTRSNSGKTTRAILDSINDAGVELNYAVSKRFGSSGEW